MTKSSKSYRGFYNRYRREMPFLEIILKDLNYLGLALKNFVKNKFHSKTILVYPHYPSRGSTIYKVAKKLGYNISNKYHPTIKQAVYWEYLTFRAEYQFLEEISDKVNIVNLHSRDISKIYVDKIHQQIFGYSTSIDPFSYQGKIVKKSDINAKHDGEILTAPLNKKEDDFIYQILIDNTDSDKYVVDIRVPVIGEVLDFVYIKYREIAERFKNSTNKTELATTTEIFSQEEIDLLNTYCKALKLEYGELDVLRNKDDGKIYVVDVNNTPQGPPENTSSADETIALSKMSLALEKLFSIAVSK